MDRGRDRGTEDRGSAAKEKKRQTNDEQSEKEILQIKRKLIYYVNRKAWRSHIR